MKAKHLTFMALGLTLIYLVYGLASFSRAEQAGERKVITKGKVKIIEEKGPAGHKTIGIDESSLGQDAGKELALTFSTLMTWDYDRKKNPPPPENVKKLDGRKVRITGFMFPLQEGSNIQNFCLLRTTQTCCYGPRPQYNQYIFVEMAKPTPFRRLDPVTCVGKLMVEPTPEEGYIYRMEGDLCEAVTEKGS
ncbi:MAG: DUF3299 domain-containing protein [candidate division NC10 bacterium]|nr:DUF3299 domain-containing protein [candidate division NC10 bacterium]